MSIYGSLGFPVPVISYTILHQPGAGEVPTKYESVMRTLHARLAEESAAAGERNARAVAEISARQVQMLRGSLAQFLETPIRSDNAELQRIFQESFDKFREQVADTGPHGVVGSTEGRISPAGGTPLARKMEAAGRGYLGTLGFVTGKNAPPVYESVYVVHGGTNLDVLEHLVRDRVGIYNSTHGDHLAGVGAYTFAAHNLILAEGEDLSRAHESAWGEAVLVFSKPAMPYDAFRAGLSPVIGALARQAGIASVTVWQRKLGLGRGEEFLLRSVVADPKHTPLFLECIHGLHHANPSAVAALLGGRLLVKRYVRLRAD